MGSATKMAYLFNHLLLFLRMQRGFANPFGKLMSQCASQELPWKGGSGRTSACNGVMPWLMYLVSRYEDSELEGDDGEDDEDDEDEEEEEEEEEEKEEEGRFHL
jgi:hypothetical protein